MSQDRQNEIKGRGIGAAPGVCIGWAVVMGAEAGGVDESRPVVLVGREFRAEEVLSMDASMVAGFISATGGVTDPAGIVATGAGLVAVMGFEQWDLIRSGDLVVVDGITGDVTVNPSPAMITRSEKRVICYRQEQEDLQACHYLPAETKDGFKVEVLASVDLVDALPQAIMGGATGIGLLRSEFYYLTGDGAPDENFLYSLYQHGLSSVAPLPVTVRTLDLIGGAQVQGFTQEPCHNPALGLKGTRFSMAHPSLFKTQLRALFRASAFGRLRILLPMIGSLDELRGVKKLIVEVQHELSAQGVAMGDDVEIGMMIEVPAAALMAESLAQEVDFFMIASNDLIHYSLAIDRTNQEVAPLYDPLHPALLQMIAQVIEAGHAGGIAVGLAGEMAGVSLFTPLLLGLGLDWLSMPVAPISRIKNRIRAVSFSQCESLATSVLRQTSSQKSRQLLQEFATQLGDTRDVG